MIASERHIIRKKHKNRKLYKKVDGYCYLYKNLRNATNFIIKQCSRISYKLKQGEILDSWEKYIIYNINCAIYKYNKNRNYPLAYIDENNGYISDMYFLSWYMKFSKEWKEIPFATCGQICIQTLCRDWKSFYKGMKEYNKGNTSMLGRPRPPRYYDKDTGREWLILTNQNVRLQNNGTIILPKFLDGIHLKVNQKNIKTIKQVRIKTENDKIVIHILFEVDEVDLHCDKSRVMSIDLGVNNFATVTSNTEIAPFIINGRPIKSMNQYYNKRKAELISQAEICNKIKDTKRLCRLTERRNNKVKDYMHKASYKILKTAIDNNIGTVIIGNNKGWKQNVSLGHQTNQNFVGIPYHQFIQMIKYKCEFVGITVKVVDERYTSGTSYLDDEKPIQSQYNKSRRIYRGLFMSNRGITINADVNGSYQIMKKGGIVPPIKAREKVVRLNVA